MFVGSPRVPRQDGEKETRNLRRESPVREFPSPFHTGLSFPITSYSCIHPKTRELLPWRQSSFPATINEGCPPQGFPEKLARNYPSTFYSVKMQQDSREQEFLLTLPGRRSRTLAQFPLPHITNLLESPWWNSCQTHARGELSHQAGNTCSCRRWHPGSGEMCDVRKKPLTLLPAHSSRALPVPIRSRSLNIRKLAESKVFPRAACHPRADLGSQSRSSNFTTRPQSFQLLANLLGRRVSLTLLSVFKADAPAY